ncbi:MAG: methylated-DNA--[protein]-cysteine S-methyltransferase [Bacteroidota bacterium]
MTGPGLFDQGRTTSFIHSSHVRLIGSAYPADERSDVSFSQADTVYGPVRIFSTAEGIVRLDLLAASAPRAAISIPAGWKEKHEPIHALAAAFISAKQWTGPSLSLNVHGTSFQLSVWRALLEIPHGQHTTYGAIATALGDAKLSRAVGAAVGSNPVAVIIPCHRVIAATGKIGAFRWGEEMKRTLVRGESYSGENKTNQG